MEWIQTLSIIGTVVGSAYYIHRDTREELEELKAQSQRTDRLYEMFIDLLKEKK